MADTLLYARKLDTVLALGSSGAVRENTRNNCKEEPSKRKEYTASPIITSVTKTG